MYDEDFVLSKIPSTRPISIEIAGEPDYGKSHTARTFPNPLFLDTEGKSWIVLQKFSEPAPWKRVKNFNDIRQGIRYGIDNSDIDTIVIDSGSDIRDLAQKEWLDEAGKDRVFPLVLWGEIYAKIDTLVRDVKDSGKNFVTTSRLKDQFLGDQRTGRRIRDSYKKFPWTLSMGVEIVDGIWDHRIGAPKFKERKFGRVYKNNFYGIDQVKAVTFQKPYIFDVSYEGIKNEMLKPWRGEDGVKLGHELDAILEEAEEWLLANV